MIDKLTPEQEALMEVYRDKWIKIGLQTGPCNREEAKKYAIKAYERGGLTPPKDFYFARSPMEAIDIIQKLNKESKQDVLAGQMYGNQDAYWLSYYDYFLEVLNIKECEILDGLIGLAKNCGWWNAYDDFCILQDRPEEIHRNANNDLHNESGPAVRYSDGFCVYVIDGHRTTEQVVMRPETLTIEQIHSETNADLMSIMCDRFGWPRYIKETKSKLIDTRKNEVENTIESLFQTKKFGKRLMVTCPTGRVFVKGLPNSNKIKTCEQAQYWLGNDEAMEYNVIGRT